MTIIYTENTHVESAYKAFRDTIKPVEARKSAIIRSCGSTPDVDVDLTTGAFSPRMSAKPPRWIVRVEGALDQPDALTVHAELVLGQYNMTKGVDIAVARVLFLHRDRAGEAWHHFDQYECRLAVMASPSLPEGSSSVALRVPLAETRGDPLPAMLSVAQRRGPTQTVAIHHAMLLCPPPGESPASIEPDHQAALEGALLRILEQWPMTVGVGERDETAHLAFARVFDELEVPTVNEQVSEGYAPAPGHIDDAAYRRFRLAQEAGFTRFIVVSPDADTAHAMAADIRTLMTTHTRPVNDMPCLLVCEDNALPAERVALQERVEAEPAWVMIARSHAQASASLGHAQRTLGACTITAVRKVAARDLLQQAYRNASMTPPGDSEDISQHLLFLTWQALEATLPEYAEAQPVDAIFQMCLRLAPADTSWNVPVDDPTQIIWVDTLALMLPAILSGVGNARKERFARYLGDATQIRSSAEAALLALI